TTDARSWAKLRRRRQNPCPGLRSETMGTVLTHIGVEATVGIPCVAKLFQPDHVRGAEETERASPEILVGKLDARRQRLHAAHRLGYPGLMGGSVGRTGSD